MFGEVEVTVVGNLAASPEVKFTASGVAVANFTVCSSTRRRDKTTGEWVDGDTMFLRCTAWREAAEHIGQSLEKGTRVMVTGRLKQRSYETTAGDKRTVIEVEVDECGPSLKYAVAQVRKVSRQTAPAWAEPKPDAAADAPGLQSVRDQSAQDAWAQDGLAVVPA